MEQYYELKDVVGPDVILIRPMSATHCQPITKSVADNYSLEEKLRRYKQARAERGFQGVVKKRTVRKPIHKDARLETFKAKGKGDVMSNRFKTGVFKADPLVDHALSPEVESILSKELLGSEEVNEVTDDFFPQVRVRDINVTLDLPALARLASVYPGVAISKGIKIDDLITVGSGPVGVIYLSYVTILYDLFLATKGEISIFATAPSNYWKVRAALSPRTVDGFLYSFVHASGQEDFSVLLGAGISTKIGDLFSAAWKTGMETPEGETVLYNGMPVLVINDLVTSGILATTDLWSSMLASVESESMCSNEPPERYYETAAAFAECLEYPQNAYLPFSNFTSEVPIQKEFLYLTEMCLGVPSGRLGKHTYPRPTGCSAFAFKVAMNDTSRKDFFINMKQISVSEMYAAALSQLCVADLKMQGIKTTGGAITQDVNTSAIASMEGGQYVRYIHALIAKRFAINAAVGISMGALNPNCDIVGAGMKDYVSYQVLPDNFPFYLEEAMADLSQFVKRRGSSETYDVYLPVLIRAGTLTGPNPIDNVTATATNTVDSMITTIYPNASVPVGYAFKAPTLLPLALNFDKQDTMIFNGSSLTTAFLQCTGVYNSLQGFILIGPSLANNHGECTLNYYTALCDGTESVQGYDVSNQAMCKAISNKYAFDPNMVADTLTRILPVIFADDPDPYIGMTGEVVSAVFSQSLQDFVIPSATENVHDIAGMGLEQDISDVSTIAQHKGGGFMDVLKKIGQVALPVLGQVGGQVLNSFVPGMGGVVNGLANAAAGALGTKQKIVNGARNKFIKKVLRSSSRNPYAPILRPLSSGLLSNGASRRSWVQPRMEIY